MVLSEGFANPGLVSQFTELGAVSVIAINPGVDIHWGTCTTVWGTPDLDDLPRKPSIPAVAVNRESGDALIELAKTGTEVTIFADMEEGWFKSKLPEVFIKGTEEPEKYVFLHGHYDTWDVGVWRQLRPVMQRPCSKSPRVLWANRDKASALDPHLRGGPATRPAAYAGSTWFSDNFALDLDDNCVASAESTATAPAAAGRPSSSTSA